MHSLTISNALAAEAVNQRDVYEEALCWKLYECLLLGPNVFLGEGDEEVRYRSTDAGS